MLLPVFRKTLTESAVAEGSLSLYVTTSSLPSTVEVAHHQPSREAFHRSGEQKRGLVASRSV